MKKIYFHPERDKIDNIPVFTNYYQYQAINYFLRVIEALNPQFVEDLNKIVPIYTTAERLHKPLDDSNGSIVDMSDWAVLEKANPQCNSHLLELRDAIIEWAQKYNLVDNSLSKKTFLEIGLWAIPSKRNHPAEIEKKKKFYTKIGRELPQYIINWSITDSIYIEDEEELDEKKIKDKVFTGDEFPFVFTPNSENMNQYNITGLPIEAHSFENIYTNYEFDLFEAFNGRKENIQGYTLGYAWDPRDEPWSEFEKNLDIAFRQYKNLYKNRTESYIKNLGYIEGKEKRNREHFEWLVRFQIQGWTIKEIADYYSEEEKVLGEDTIKKALHCTSNIIGITLR
ncbi:hypothetical protein [Bacillus thuringiensis]|uniref:hypothetical protein n=1 Tax=Bacillus thuringiensis TaxID=1428 RepID=UPI0011A20545|nr:hypothetical protein [Bacillus thuringiensis]